MPTSLLKRRQPYPGHRRTILAGVGGAVAIAALGIAPESGPVTLLMAGFGATCVLVFALPTAPLSQPANVVGGHLVTTLAGLSVAGLLPVSWWSTALAVGAGIALMVALRVTHPPAGANPIVVMSGAVGWDFAIDPVLIGSIALVVVAMVFHRLSGTAYPVRDEPRAARLRQPVPTITEPVDVKE